MESPNRSHHRLRRGEVVAQQRYLPFGGVRWNEGALPTDRQYTGQRWDEILGLYDYKARYYDPLLARFIQPDTLVPEPGDPQSLNRYAYVRNNPLRYNDPTGHRLCGPEDHPCPSPPRFHVTPLPPWARWLLKASCFAFGCHVDVKSGVLSGQTLKEQANTLFSPLPMAVEATGASELAEGALRREATNLQRFLNVGREDIPTILEAFGDTIPSVGEDLPQAFADRRVTTLGRTWDIEAAKELGGFRVLNAPK